LKPRRGRTPESFSQHSTKKCRIHHALVESKRSKNDHYTGDHTGKAGAN
jgi:hypothetical protein